MEIWTLVALAIANLVLAVCAAAAQAAGQSTPAAPNCWRANERMERELRREISESSRGARSELTHTLAPSRRRWSGRAPKPRARRTRRSTPSPSSSRCCRRRWSDTLSLQLQNLGESNARRMAEVRAHAGGAAHPAAADQRRQARRDAQDGRREAADHAGNAPGRELQAGRRPAGAGAQGPGRDADAGAGRGRPAARADQRQDARHVRRGAARGAAGAGAHARAVRQAGRDQAAQQPAGRLRDPLSRPQQRRHAGLAADRRQVSARRLRAPARRARPRRPRGRRHRGPRAGSRASAPRPSRSARTTCARRTPPTSPSCSCRSKACMPRCCGAPA